MSLPRRLALLRWADREDAAIVEDDYDSEFRFGGRPIEPLQRLDGSGRVLYASSFSKTLLPSLRLGFVVTPASLRPAIRAAKYVADWSTSTPQQLALAEFIERGWFARHLRAMRSLYRERHELIAATLRDELASVLKTIPSDAGLHLSALAPEMTPAEAATAIRLAGDDGVVAYALASFGELEPRPAGVVLGYGAVQLADIPEALRRLARQFGA